MLYGSLLVFLQLFFYHRLGTETVWEIPYESRTLSRLPCTERRDKFGLLDTTTDGTVCLKSIPPSPGRPKHCPAWPPTHTPVVPAAHLLTQRPGQKKLKRNARAAAVRATYV